MGQRKGFTDALEKAHFNKTQISSDQSTETSDIGLVLEVKNEVNTKGKTIKVLEKMIKLTLTIM